jgi:hypothetical protein
MTSLRLFIIGLLRHWLLVLSGPLLSAVLAVVERSTAVAINFRWYVVLMAAGVMVAAYRAWLDEHRARLDAESRADLNRPAVVLTIRGAFNSQTPPFALRNSGAVTAFNIRIAPLTLSDRTLEFEAVADLAANAEVPVNASIRGAGPFWARDVLQFFERGYAPVVEGQLKPPTEEEQQNASSAQMHDYLAASMGLGELVVPLVVYYRDLAGTEYATQQHFVFEVIANGLQVRLVSSTRKSAMPPVPAPFVVPGSRAARRSRQT